MTVLGSEVMELEVFYDYLCPFVYRASVMLHSVAPSRNLKVTWRYFSLAQVNSKDEGWTIWDAPSSERVKGRLAFRAAEAARRQDHFEELHTPLLQARHRDRLDIDQLEVVERVAVDSGLDLERFRKDIGDPGILDSLARDHREAVSRHGVFGTPTIVFPDGASAYIRLGEAPEDAAAIRVFDHLLAVAAGEPTILEIKSPSNPAPD